MSLWSHRKIVCLALLSALPSASSSPEITLANGDVLRGSSCASNAVHSFRGIPYAQPPLGGLRFLAPRKLDKLLASSPSSPFNASHAGAPCIQYSKSFRVDDPMPSEDCLTLDVYAPSHANTKSSLPVKVWTYGGSNKGGATSWPLYDGCNLATDSILVEFNYRLGPLGFLSLKSAGIPGNMGIQDALLALNWVHDNIESFGGNSSNVLLFGQSAGGGNTFILSTLPETKGLISAAVSESGLAPVISSAETGEMIGASFASALMCSKVDLSCLQSRSLEELGAAFKNTPVVTDSKAIGQLVEERYGVDVPNTLNMHRVVLDGKIVSKQPLLVGPHVPIMAGSAENDGAFFTLPSLIASGNNLVATDYQTFLDDWGPKVGAAIGKQYPLSQFNTTGSTAAAVASAITHLVTVSGFTCPVYYVLQSAANVESYAYRYNHTPSCQWLELSGKGVFPPSQFAGEYGATHTSELPFVFGNLANLPFGKGGCNSTKEEYKMSRQLRGAWLAMAQTGSPATEGLEWPVWDSYHPQGVYINGKASPSTLDFHECQFWSEIWETLAGFKFSGLGKQGDTPNYKLISTSPGSTGTSPSSKGQDKSSPSIHLVPSLLAYLVLACIAVTYIIP